MGDFDPSSPKASPATTSSVGASPAADAPRKRPIAVWVISIIYFITVFFSLLSLPLIPYMLSGTTSGNDVHRQYFSLGIIFECASTFLLMILNLAGALLLFFLQRPAVYCFGAVIVLDPLYYLCEIFFTNGLGAIGYGSASVVIISDVSFSLAVFGYALYLYRTKVLR
ncbi:MAG TPA: hypothetical protein VL981_00205 [Candidatus Methylacidiphilales bacterium]|nr:hypothetical protein [Candidatus Methylacidiphilales bacterium]